jgi:Tol biopolymer transport system component
VGSESERTKPATRRWPVSLIGFAILLASIVVTIGFLAMARGLPQPPTLSGPPANGLIAYSFDSDIYVGDPVSGATTAIVSGRESDINPKFSPDGTRIAFVRGTPTFGPSSLIVVRSDGSGELVVVPEGFSQNGIGPFAWTPDGARIVAEVDYPPSSFPHGDGELVLFDASGSREPRLLTPPLTAWVGGIYFNPSAQVAPMFRPPDGGWIIDTETMNMFDADLEPVPTSDRQVPAADEVSGAWDPTWSPDGTRILMWLDGDVIVMSATGWDIQRIAQGWLPMWSPDNSSVAFEAFSHFDPDGTFDFAGETQIAVHDLTSGAKRILRSSVSPVKRGAAVQTITNNTHHTWYYEGWSWSPDGRSLLLLKDHRTRPVVIDVASDMATELPWQADSFPSWQRVAMEQGS